MRKINGRGGIKEREALCESTIFLSVTLEREEESVGWRTKEDIALLRKTEGGIRQVWIYYCTFTDSRFDSEDLHSLRAAPRCLQLDGLKSSVPRPVS